MHITKTTNTDGIFTNQVVRRAIVCYNVLNERYNTMTGIKQCYYCDVEMKDDWNLFPVGANFFNTKRLYDWDKVICDGCYDNHCTKYNIQPLKGE